MKIYIYKNTVILYRNDIASKFRPYHFNDILKKDNYIVIDTEEIAKKFFNDNINEASEKEINIWIEQYTNDIKKEIYEKIKNMN